MKRSFESLVNQRVWNRTRAVRIPGFFFVLYMATIVAFAAIYYSCGAEAFYCPYIRSEWPAAMAGKAAMNTISEVLDRNKQKFDIGRFGEPIYPRSGKIVLYRVQHISSADIGYIEFDSKFIAKDMYGSHLCDYHITMDLADIGHVSFNQKLYGYPTAEIYYGIPVIVADATDINSDDLKSCDKIRHTIFDSYINYTVDDVSAEPLPLPFPLKVHRPLATMSLILSSDEYKDLLEYMHGQNGDARYVPRFFERMLYFSATTITTTGFGDILPLTRRTRGFAGLEAISGWIIAGLFLNSLALSFRGSNGVD